MRIEVGDWLEEAGHREIEGTIRIERVRFLHVSAELNHWQPATSEPEQLQPGQVANNEQAVDGSGIHGSAPDTTGLGSIPRVGGAMEGSNMEAGALAANMTPQQTSKELVTWIRENRRMRSEEIHFIDSPTLSVLIFFKKIENGESASAPVN